MIVILADTSAAFHVSACCVRRQGTSDLKRYNHNHSQAIWGPAW